jgi:hypothetical protein
MRKGGVGGEGEWGGGGEWVRTDFPTLGLTSE